MKVFSKVLEYLTKWFSLVSFVSLTFMWLKITLNDFFLKIENAVDSGIREAEEIVKSEVEDIKEVIKSEVEDIKEVEIESSTEKVEKMSIELIEEKTEKPTNVEWASDDQESVTGFKKIPDN